MWKMFNKNFGFFWWCKAHISLCSHKKNVGQEWALHSLFPTAFSSNWTQILGGAGALQNSPLHCSAPASSAGLVPGMWGRARNPVLPRIWHCHLPCGTIPWQLHLPHPQNGIRWSRGGSEIGHPWALGCCWPWAMRVALNGHLSFPLFFDIFVKILNYVHHGWNLCLRSHCSFCFFFSYFVFSGLSCSIPYSLCALCVDILEVCFHSPNTTRQKGKKANTFYSLQNKSKDVKENSKILHSSWFGEESERQMCFFFFSTKCLLCHVAWI